MGNGLLMIGKLHRMKEPPLVFDFYDLVGHARLSVYVARYNENNFLF